MLQCKKGHEAFFSFSPVLTLSFTRMLYMCLCMGCSSFQTFSNLFSLMLPNETSAQDEVGQKPEMYDDQTCSNQNDKTFSWVVQTGASKLTGVCILTLSQKKKSNQVSDVKRCAFLVCGSALQRTSTDSLTHPVNALISLCYGTHPWHSALALLP